MTLPITEPGLYDITDTEYHGDCCDGPSISSSGLKVVSEDPSEFWRTSYLNPDRDPPPRKKAWDIGKAAHWLLLEPDVAAKRIAVIPASALASNGGIGTKAAKEIIADAEANGQVAIKPSEWAMIEAMRDALAEHSMVRRALRKGRAEASLIFKDPDTGVWLKSRPDYMPAKSGMWISDYKTTDAADVNDWMRRSIIDFRLDMQAVLQLWAAKEVMGIEACGVLYIVQSKKPPHRVTIRTLRLDSEGHTGLLLRARVHLRHAIHTFADCMESGHWPSPWDQSGDIELPGWFAKQVEFETEQLTHNYGDSYVI